MYIKLDEGAKPTLVNNVKEFRSFMSHAVALRATTASKGTNVQKPAGEENMDTGEVQKTPSTTSQQQQPKTGATSSATTPQQSTHTSGTQHTPVIAKTPTSHIDLPHHSPTDVTIDSNLPSPFLLKNSYTPITTKTPTKAEIARRNYAALWGCSTPLRNFNASVQKEMTKSNTNMNLSEACFGFGDESMLASPFKYPSATETSTPLHTPSRNQSAAGKFSTPPKMQFSQINIKPVKFAASAAATAGAAASPASAMAKSKVTPTKQMTADSGTSSITKSHDVPLQTTSTEAGKNADQAVHANTTPDKQKTPTNSKGTTPTTGPYSPYVMVSAPVSK